MVGMERPFAGLKALALSQPRAPGIADATHLGFVALVASRLDQAGKVARLKGWLVPEGAALREAGAREAIEALLRPWAHGSPPGGLRRDRRVDRGAQPRPPGASGRRLVGFDADLKAVLFRWLTEADMRFFCDVVTATQDSHVWAPRRNYWLRLLREKRIEAAWVAFCPAAEDYARRRLTRQGSAAAGRRFGRQDAGGGRADASLLIMRIGGKTVVDGCHSYRTHTFEVDDRSAQAVRAILRLRRDRARLAQRQVSHLHPVVDRLG